MSWLIRIDPMPKENFRKWLAEQDITEQIRDQPEESRQLQLRQFDYVREAASQFAHRLPGPKLAGKIEGHANPAGDALPTGSQHARIIIDLYQVRFAGES